MKKANEEEEALVISSTERGNDNLLREGYLFNGNVSVAEKLTMNWQLASNPEN
jgi:hypothetical protein